MRPRHWHIPWPTQSLYTVLANFLLCSAYQIHVPPSAQYSTRHSINLILFLKLRYLETNGLENIMSTVIQKKMELTLVFTRNQQRYMWMKSYIQKKNLTTYFAISWRLRRTLLKYNTKVKVESDMISISLKKKKKNERKEKNRGVNWGFYCLLE